MEIKDVVLKLVGNVNPVGETNTDDKRFENLKTLCGVVDELIYEIQSVTRNKHAQEYSVKRAGEYAERWCKDSLFYGE